jgi:2'-5' RNA ligase
MLKLIAALEASGEAGDEAGAVKVFWQYLLDKKALAAFGRVVSAVESVLGDDLSVPDLRPHVTLLYMGDVPRATLPEVYAAGRDALTMGGMAWLASSVGWFPVTARSEGNQPIVLHVEAPLMEKVNIALLRALAPWVTKAQFQDFRPHITIGYLTGRTLTPTEERRLQGLALPAVRGEMRRVAMSAGDVDRFVELV